MTKTELNNIPCELKEAFRWVRTIGDDKRPYCVYGNTPASSTHPDTWGTYDEAVEMTRRTDGWLGYVFHDDGYVGIDIDHCVSETGAVAPNVVEIIQKFNSYTERSKSGDGIHIIIKGDIPFKGKQQNGYEIYKTARFFVLTGQVYKGSSREINSNDDYLKEFIEQYFNKAENISSTSVCKWQPSWSEFNGRIPIYPTYPTVSAGSRHLMMVSFCGQWWNGGISENDLLRLALRVNKDYFTPPLDEKEVREVVKSCARYRR